MGQLRKKKASASQIRSSGWVHDISHVDATREKRIAWEREQTKKKDRRILINQFIYFFIYFKRKRKKGKKKYNGFETQTYLGDCTETNKCGRVRHGSILKTRKEEKEDTWRWLNGGIWYCLRTVGLTGISQREREREKNAECGDSCTKSAAEPLL